MKNDHLIEELPRQFKLEEEMNNSRRTIIEILNMVWNSENKVMEKFFKENPKMKLSMAC